MNGDGVEQDKIHAYAWFSILSEQGNVMDLYRRDSLEKELTEEEIEQANKLKQEISANITAMISTSM